MNRRSFGIVGLVAAISLTLGACSTGASSPSSSAAGGDTSLSDVKSKGEIVFGTEGTYKPFSYHENGAGDLTGFDVDVAKAVAGKLGVKASFQETQFDGIFAGLDAKRFDAIANQISITPERQAKYSLSTPYTVSPGVVVTKSDNNDIHSIADLKGKTTAQSLTSNWFKVAQDAGANVQAVEGWAQSVSLLKEGRVDATVNDKLTYLDYVKTNKDSGLKVAAETTDKSKSAIAMRKGATALTDAVDKALADLAADGTLAKISTKYFDADVTK
ncbi:MAG: amino acid ABC transporter substrate-binding protein [Actinomycetales bacterium]